MAGHQVVEEDLVGVLQLAQIDVPVQRLVVAEERLVRAVGLLVEGLHRGREQPVETEFRPFPGSKAVPLLRRGSASRVVPRGICSLS